LLKKQKLKKMTYNAQYIEEVFTRIASIRIGEKIQGDGGY